jgi:hypothetical protein
VQDEEAFSTLVDALRPWLGQLVFAGGWAHRLHRLHPLATPPAHRPVVTRDVDIALAARTSVAGDIGAALDRAGFVKRFVGTDNPPVTHYELGDARGAFYAEFLTPLLGDGRRRNGEPDVVEVKAGITVQKLRHLEVLLIEPWTVPVRLSGRGVKVTLAVANAVTFIVQKLLIHDKRKPSKRAQDVLYIHDTLELFGPALDELVPLWRERIRPALTSKQGETVRDTATKLFQGVSDVLREAARIPQDRRLSPEAIRSACAYGLGELFGDREL